jgi:eukaryotic-like serine/threonine-protein kinase
VLLDFGLARQLDGGAGLTRSAAVLGTPQYMSPEQAGSATQVRPSADVFSLGCIFYECLAGKSAFAAAHMVGVLARILFDEPEPIRTLRPAVPQAWQDLLGRMLRKDPALRPPDAAALLADLRALPPVADELAEAGSPPPPKAALDGGDQVLVCVVLAVVDIDDVVVAAGDPAARDADADATGSFESVRTALGRSGCALERMADGSVLATILPRPSAADQARIAAHCALALRALWPRARIAVTTGRAPLDRGGRVGEAVDRAARLLDSPAAGIRIDSLTGGLLEGGRYRTETHGQALVLAGEEDPDLDQSRPLLGKPTPCVGREVELGQLEGLMATVLDERTPRAAVVLGPPGIGKSRLRHELGRRLRARHPQAQLLVGHGDPLTAGSPYVIVADALRRHAGIRVGDPPAEAQRALRERLGRHVPAAQQRRVCEFLGELAGVPFPDEDSPPLRAARADHRVKGEQIALAFHDWVAAEGAAHPLVFVLEDVQWGDALTVKLFEGLLRDLEAGLLLVLALGRPETEEAFPRLLAGARAVSLSLRPLSGKASEALVRRVLGEAIDADSLRRLVRMAGGNALFLEELIRASADGQAGDVPATVLAMLQARLSRLPAEARTVLRAASILGETFWRGAVAKICEAWKGTWTSTDGANPGLELDRWLTQLVEAELVEKPRGGRFPGDVQYAFRHALVCEAAAGLLGETDRRAGHRAAGHWLETMGETDGIVLARHAQEADDSGRAITFYVRAAEQSIALHDFGEAIARASRGMSCGAEGEALGILESVRASALYSMGRWKEAAEVGQAAMALLPRGGLWWCETAEKLLQVLPNVHRLDLYTQLSEQMLHTTPAPEARHAHLRALNVQLLGYAISAAHAKGRACIAHIERISGGAIEKDVVSRGYARLWRAVYTNIADADMPRALVLTEQAERDLRESQVFYRLSLAHVVKSFIYWGLGRHDDAADEARRGRAVAGEIRDDYHSVLASWYLGLALCEQPEPDKQDEALLCAQLVADSKISPQYESFLPAILRSRVAVARGQWDQAAADGKTGQEGIADFLPYALIGGAYRLMGLTGGGRHQEAAVVARDGLAALARLDGPIFTEVIYTVAAAEALWSAGARDEARAALAQARRQVEARTALMAGADVRATFLARRPENRRLVELEQLFGAGSAGPS